VSVSYNCILVTRTSPRWAEYLPKHFDENIVNKIRHNILKCILLVMYVFLEQL